MVDDQLIPAIGPQRGLDGAGDGPAGVDVAQDGAIFGVVARLLLAYVVHGGGCGAGILLITGLEKAAVGCVGY